MKKLILAVAVAGVFAGGVAHAQEAASPHSFTGNVSVVSDYRFRGISQTFKQPAIQGGFDYEHSSGFYIGNWNSNVSDASFGPGGNLEMDLYGGYKFEVTPDFGMDVGILRYYYPGTNTNWNTTELYVAGSYKWFSAKYSHSTTDFFAAADSKGSGYLEMAADFEVAEKTTLGFHVGHQKVKNNSASNYTDYKVSLARDFGFAEISLSVVGTSGADKGVYEIPNVAGTKTKNLAGTGAVLAISKSF